MHGPLNVRLKVALHWSECCILRSEHWANQISKLCGPFSQKTVIFCATSLSILSVPCLFGFKETVRTEPVDSVYRRNTAAGGWHEVFCHDGRKLPVSNILLNDVLWSVPASQKMLQFHYKHQPINAGGEIVAVHSYSVAECINIPCGQNSGFLSIEVGSKYIKWFIHTSDQKVGQFKI